MSDFKLTRGLYQAAFIVPDLDAAMREWTERAGADRPAPPASQGSSH